MRRNATMLVIWLILWGIVQPEGRAQDLPEIRELRVPERRVGDYFPPGTALRVLTRPEWDATLERARRGIDAAQESRVPRILKARHEARWDAGRLIGQSRFEVSNAESRPCAVHLEPWSLACEAGEGVLVPRTRADGSLVLWLEEDAPTPYQVRWQARAREGSDGRIFAFTLPAASVSSLELELPQDLEPISTTGQRSRVGAPSASGVARWKFDGITGPVVLALRQAGAETPALLASMRVHLGPTLATVVVDAELLNPSRAARTLALRLDPGLWLESVSGPDVVSYATKANEGATQVEIRVAESAADRSRLLVRAATRVPLEGDWVVPAVRAVNAAWLPGRTLISVDASRTVVNCIPLDGEPVAPHARETNESPGQGLLAFQCLGTGPVARLSLQPRQAPFWATVRGKLTVGQSRLMLTAAVTIGRRGGGTDGVSLSLPNAFHVSHVQLSGLDEATSWSLEPGDGDIQRVRVNLPTYLSAEGPLVIDVEAWSTSFAAGTLESPRIEVERATQAPSSWAVAIDPFWKLGEVTATRTTWIDPADLAAPNTGEPGPSFVDATLAWQGGTDARVKFRLSPDERTSNNLSLTVVTLGSQGTRIDWYSRVPQAMAGDCVVGWPRDLADANEIAWSVWRDGAWRSVTTQSVMLKQRSAIRLALGDPRPDESCVVRASWTLKASNQFDIAHLTCEGAEFDADQLLVRAEAGLVPRLKTDTGQERLPQAVAAWARREFPQAQIDTEGIRNAAAASWPADQAAMALAVRRLTPLPAAALVREAVIVSRRQVDTGIREHLILELDTPAAAELQITLPVACALIHARWADDRACVVCEPEPGTLRVAVPESARGRSRLILETMRTPHPAMPTSGEYQFSWPCLAYRRFDSTETENRVTHGAGPWWKDALWSAPKPTRFQAESSTAAKPDASVLDVHETARGLGPLSAAGSRANFDVERWVTAATAAVVMLVGSLLGSARGRWVVSGLVLVVGTSLLLAAQGYAWCGAIWWGATLGAVTLALCWSIGRGRRQNAVPASPSSTVTLARLTTAILLAAILASWSRGAQQAAAPGRPPDGPIVVLVPQSANAPAAGEAESLVMKLADFERIVAMTKAVEAATLAMRRDRTDAFGATSAVHRMVGQGPNPLFESRYVFEGGTAEPHVWMVPLGPILEAHAFLDGENLPIQLGEGAKEARVSVVGPGRHELVLRQVLADRNQQSRALPIRPVCDARVEGLGDAAAAVEWLGPVASIERDAGPNLRDWEQGVLWDATPASDIVHARLQPTSGGAATHEFSLDADWLAFTRSQPGRAVLLTSRPDGSQRRWRLDVFPALDDATPMELLLVRPTREAGARRAPPSVVTPASTRVAPTVVVIRAPVGWKVSTPNIERRISPAAALDIIGERSRSREADGLRAVGSLILEPGKPTPSVELMPQRVAPRASTRAEVDVYAKRLDLRLEARFDVDADAWAGEQDAEIPAELQIVDVAGDGLDHWSRPAPGLLKLWFRHGDPRSAAQRVTLRGYLPLGDSPTNHMPKLPWPVWLGATAQEGELILVDSQQLGLQVEGMPGLMRAPSDLGARQSPPRVAFRVAAGSTPGRLILGPVAPRADVQVQSWLRFHPAQVEWLALAHYNVRNGPCGEIRLELPAEWASGCEVTALDGQFEVRRVRESGSPLVILTPRTEAWGPQRILVHAARARNAVATTFPTLTPLGLGRVDTFLAWSNESDQAVVAEGGAGLQPVESSRFAPFLKGGTLPNSLHAYRVLRSGWSILLREMGNSTATEAFAPAADVECAVGETGCVFGMTRISVPATKQHLFEFRLPAGVVPLRAFCAGSPATLLLDREHQTCVVEPSESPVAEVCLMWQRLSDREMTSPAAAFDVPLPLDGPGEVLITLRLPESWTDDSLRTTGLRRTTASDLRWQRMQSVADMIRGFASAESNAGASGNNLRMLVGRLARWAEAARTAGGTAAERASRLCGEVAEALEPNNPREAAILRGTRTAVDPLAVVDPSESLMSQLPGVTHNFRSLGKWTIRRATSQSPGVPTPAPLWLMALISVATLLALFLTPRTRGRARSAISAALAVGCVALVPELWMLGVISLLCLALRESGPQAAAA